jgi:tetratricopeptide (TPR) repeat protein
VRTVTENPRDLDGNTRELLDVGKRPERKSSQQVVLEAIEEHKEKIASDPEDREVPAYQLAIANLYVTKLGDYETASIHLEELIEEFPDSNLVSEAYAKLGNCYENLGWSSVAKATYKRMMKHFPEDSESYAYARAKREGAKNVR